MKSYRDSKKIAYYNILSFGSSASCTFLQEIAKNNDFLIFLIFQNHPSFSYKAFQANEKRTIDVLSSNAIFANGLPISMPNVESINYNRT